MTTNQACLDTVLAEAGNFGKYQYRIIALICFAIMFAYMPGIIWIFETKVPSYRCEINGCETYPIQYKPSWWTEAIPSVEGEPATCEKYKRVNTSVQSCSFNKKIIERCERYVYATSERSMLHDFNLHCEENLWKLTLIGTMSSAGLFVGLPISGILSDRFGRKTILMWCLILSGLAGLIRSFSNSYVFFITMTIMDSIVRAGAYANCFIIGMEFVAPEKRAIISIFLSIFCGIVGMIVGAVAWILQTWRTLDRIMYGVCLLVVSYYWLLPESVRWLLTKERYTDVENTLRNISKTNGRDLPEETLQKLRNSSTSGKVGEVHSFEELLKSPILTRRFINCSICWTFCLFSYYGLTINSIALSNNSYLDFILTMLVEIPGNIAVYLVLNRVGRRYALSLSFLICGLSCLSFIFIPKDLYWLQLCMYLLGKFCSAMVITIIYTVTSEIFPTRLRSSLLSTCSMFGRIGSMTAPQVPILKKYWQHLPLVLFGATAVIASVLSLLFPETMGVPLPDTIEEAENIGNKIK